MFDLYALQTYVDRDKRLRTGEFLDTKKTLPIHLLMIRHLMKLESSKIDFKSVLISMGIRNYPIGLESITGLKLNDIELRLLESLYSTSRRLQLDQIIN